MDGRVVVDGDTSDDVAATRERWPLIDGIDAADASARWCGDVMLFGAMLARFFDEYAQIGAPPTGRDPEEIDMYVRIMHKLRGGACMLGARTVFDLTGQIEAACMADNRDEASRLTAALERTIRQLAENAQPVLALFLGRSAAYMPATALSETHTFSGKRDRMPEADAKLIDASSVK